MRKVGTLALAALVAVMLSGCRNKGWESFTSATEPNPPTHWKGDSYAYGGVAKASGGLNPETNYGTGADVNSPNPVNPKFDQPEMGSGQQPGEYPNVAAPGHGQTNGPSMQPQPGDVTDSATVAHG